MALMIARIGQFRRAVRQYMRYAKTPLHDMVSNRRHLSAGPRFLILRHPVRLTRYYYRVLDWLAAEMPEVRGRFELHTLPCLIRDWSRFCLLVPWLPDPLLHESPRVYARVKRLERRCRERGIGVVNPVDRVLQTAKSTGAKIIARVGIRTPKAVPIEDARRFRGDLGGLEPPFLIREDRAHAGRLPVYLVNTIRDLRDVPIERYANPIAVEFIDVRSPRDGLCRRYRYFAAGEDGLAMGLHCSANWEVRGRHGVVNANTVREELQFVSRQDPNHGRLQLARKALGLDFVAFDYSYGHDGELIVWEANVLPGLGMARPNPLRHYMKVVAERAVAMMLVMYHERGGLDVPPRVRQLLQVVAACPADHSTEQLLPQPRLANPQPEAKSA